jgi:hypothetical protein
MKNAKKGTTQMKTHYCLFMHFSGTFIVNVFGESPLNDVALDFIKHRNPLTRLSCTSQPCRRQQLFQLAVEYPIRNSNFVLSVIGSAYPEGTHKAIIQVYLFFDI